MKEWNTKRLAFCGIVAAVYCALTLLTAPLSYGPIQFRVAEALGVLPFFAPWTALGLFTGCLLANLFSTVTALDIAVGSAATLLAALWTGRLRRVWLTPLPAVVCNLLLVGGMLSAVYLPAGGFWKGFLLFGAEVGAGELAVMLLLGLPLALLIRRRGWDEALRAL